MAEAVLNQTTGLPLGERMSYQEFLAWADEDTHAEWVDGRVQPMSPVSREHSLLSGFLAQLLRFFVESRQLGEVHCEPWFLAAAGMAVAATAPRLEPGAEGMGLKAFWEFGLQRPALRAAGIRWFRNSGIGSTTAPGRSAGFLPAVSQGFQPAGLWQ